jgi:F420-0:gamma-glutamyl ligase
MAMQTYEVLAGGQGTAVLVRTEADDQTNVIVVKTFSDTLTSGQKSKFHQDVKDALAFAGPTNPNASATIELRDSVSNLLLLAIIVTDAQNGLTMNSGGQTLTQSAVVVICEALGAAVEWAEA